MPFDGVQKYGSPLNDVLAADSLERVLKLMQREDSWCQGVDRSRVRTWYFGHRHQRCLYRALLDARASAHAIELICREVRHMGFQNIVAFNDCLSTEHADILAVLHRVRDRLPVRRVRKLQMAF